MGADEGEARLVEQASSPMISRDDRIIGAQRLDQGDRRGVAIDREAGLALERAARRVPAHRRGEGELEGGEVRHGAAALRGVRIIAAARSRSAISSAKAGRLPSRSIRVGTRAGQREQIVVERPDLLGDRRVMAVDQQRLAELRIGPMAGEMDLADRVVRQRVEIGDRG